MIPDLEHSRTDSDRLHDLFQAQKKAFGQHTPLPHAKRMEALESLLQIVLQSQDRMIQAIESDFGRRSAYETRLLEIFPLVDEIRYAKRHLRSWMRARSVAANWQFQPSRAQILYQPLGVVGVIGPWNYPVLLTLSPLVNALAAGNHVLIKPSESTPSTALVLREMMAAVFPEEYVAVLPGGKDLSIEFSAMPFDHLIFTGSGETGKRVMRAAAENLTPVTLELGGKSPALVHESFPVNVAADRICAAKFWNAGQTCVAPDYAIVFASQRDHFVAACARAILKRFAHPFENRNYTQMIGKNAYERMRTLVEDAREKGATVVQPASSEELTSFSHRAFPPTIVIDAGETMRVMQEEIFGPILPVVTVTSIQDALAFIARRPHPLALYYFDHDSSRARQVVEITASGGATVNDCIFHLPQHGLPFGGVGASGMGAYHGFDGFETFSKKKGVLLQSEWTARFMARFFKPPYSIWSDRLLRILTGYPKPGTVGRISL